MPGKLGVNSVPVPGKRSPSAPLAAQSIGPSSGLPKIKLLASNRASHALVKKSNDGNIDIDDDSDDRSQLESLDIHPNPFDREL